MQLPPLCLTSYIIVLRLAEVEMSLRAWSFSIGRQRIVLECSICKCISEVWKDSSSNIIRALINPANTALSGPTLNYFPRGGLNSTSKSGPVPFLPPPDLPMSWSGAEAGLDMLYPSQVVDGVVHRLGGVDLKDYLESIPVVGKSKNFQPLRCNEGDVKLSPGFDLDFDLIAHTVPPFWISIHRWNSNTDTQICTLRCGIPSQNGYLR